MNDRKLLEDAAKAAGIVAEQWTTYGIFVGGLEGFVWNPLASDADALWLLVKLSLSVERDFDRIDVRGARGFVATEYLYEKPKPTDPHAATRRAIVRAAAALGGAK